MNESNRFDPVSDFTVGIYGYGRTGQKLVNHLADSVQQLIVYEDDPSTLRNERTDRDRNTEWVPSPQVLKHELDLMIASPGIPGDHPVLRQARESGIPVWDELEFAYRMAEGGTFWAITGTNGKSTSADLAGNLLKEKFGPERVSVCGNRGSPLTENILDGSPKNHYVVEVSSFQVEGLDSFSPDGALLTSLGDDHQNYHDSLYEYHSLKWNLLKRVKENGPIVLPKTEADRDWLSTRNSVRPFDKGEVYGEDIHYVPGEGLRFRNDSVPSQTLDASLTLFPENVLGVVALLMDELDEMQIVEGLKSFRSLDYRAGTVDTIDGRRVINDSKGTNPSAVKKLVERLESPFSIVLGGGAKKTNYTELVETLAENSPESVVLAGTGSTAERVEALCKEVGLDYQRFENWENAVKTTFEQGDDGETIVLSPGGTSFDNFENYRDRGEAFDRWIEEAADEKQTG
jgi:UDP-N-acetylmuramoylalanine--D-glutamate ligase